VLDTKTPHALVDSEYATRRASCEHAAKILGVQALRDVTPAHFLGVPSAGARRVG
jgi:galactokinase